MELSQGLEAGYGARRPGSGERIRMDTPKIHMEDIRCLLNFLRLYILSSANASTHWHANEVSFERVTLDGDVFTLKLLLQARWSPQESLSAPILEPMKESLLFYDLPLFGP